MKGVINDTVVALLLIVNQIGVNLITWKEILKSLSTKVKSTGLYLIFVMVFAQLVHTLVRMIYWIFKQKQTSSKLQNQEELKRKRTYYDDDEILGV